MLETQNKKSEIEKILGEPVIDDLSENSHRVRRNLVVFSAIALMYIWFGIKVKTINTSVVAIEGIESSEILIVLKCIVIYHLLHFICIAIEHWDLLKIRVTGTFARGRFDPKKIGDHLGDSWQSTLYSWWSDGIRNIENQFRDGESYILKQLTELEKITEQENNYIKSRIESTETIIRMIDQKIALIRKNLTSNGRILKSLKRFEKVFKSYGRWQLARWIFIELIFPIFLGFLSLFYLIFG